MSPVAVALSALTSENHNCTVPQRSDCTDRPPTAQICVVVVIWEKNIFVRKPSVCKKTSNNTVKPYN